MSQVDSTFSQTSKVKPFHKGFHCVHKKLLDVSICSEYISMHVLKCLVDCLD